MTASAMVAEFDDVAGWTADAVEQLGERHAIPAACRGSANPAAWAAKRFGVRSILLEPMPAACRAAARLFGLPVIQADGERIALRTESVDAAWCLGVLCTVRDKAALLREIHRVLMPGSPLVLPVVVARGPQVFPAPEGNLSPPNGSS